MFLIRRKNGIYYVIVKLRDGARWISTKSKNKSEATKFMVKLADHPLSLRKQQCTNITIKEFYHEYLDYCKSFHTEKSIGSTKAAFNELLRIIGNVQLRSVSSRQVEYFITEKMKWSQWTAKRCYVTVSAAFQKAIQWHYIENNPFKNVKKPKVPELLPKYFSQSEISTLLLTIQETWFKNIVLTGIYTGMRMGELLHLKWKDVNIQKRILIVNNSSTFLTKSKRIRTIPIHDNLLAVLRTIPLSNDLVFHINGVPFKKDRVSNRMKRYIRKLRLDDDLCFHSLRHTFASWLVQAGVSIFEIQKLLGHSQISTTMIYAHLHPDQLHKTVNRIDFDTTKPVSLGDGQHQ